MTRITIFGAGAAGTALAMHLAREDHDVTVWGSEYDRRVLPELLERRTHPALPEYLPEALRVLGPEGLPEAAADIEVAVMGAHSRGARSLGEMVAPALPADGAVVVSLAKGLEPGSLLRASEVYAEVTGRPVAALSGPSLASEVAEGFLTGVVVASADGDARRRAAAPFRSDAFVVEESDDVVGVELCGTAKNVAAIGAGVLEGLGRSRQRDLKNARAALFTRAVREMGVLVEALGGRRETAFGLAGTGDLLVTSLGGRNRSYGEAIGQGADPSRTLQDMERRGLTVEGAGSAKEVRSLAERANLELPVHDAVHAVVHEGAPPESILEAIR